MCLMFYVFVGHVSTIFGLLFALCSLTQLLLCSIIQKVSFFNFKCHDSIFISYTALI